MKFYKHLDQKQRDELLREVDRNGNIPFRGFYADMYLSGRGFKAQELLIRKFIACLLWYARLT